MKKIMKLKYIGETFREEGLTNGRVYDADDANEFCFCVLDDSGKKVFYSKSNPAPFGVPSRGGKWEVIEA